MNFRDAESLSAYLDGQLSLADARRMEVRLASDPNLKSVLDDLRLSRRLLGKLPKRRAPHNFTLTPLMKDVRAPEPRAVPGLRFAGLLAMLLLLATFALNSIASLAPVGLAAAPLPAYGIGGGPSTTEQPPQAFAAAPPGQAPAAATTPAPQDLTLPTTAARSEAAPKGVSPSEGGLQQARATPPRPVAAVWQLLLAGAAILFGGFAWFLQRRSLRRFHNRWLQK